MCPGINSFKVLNPPPFFLILGETLFESLSLSPDSARFSKRLSNRSSLKGITFLSLFIYKYIADTAFIFISCNQTEFGLVRGQLGHCPPLGGGGIKYPRKFYPPFPNSGYVEIREPPTPLIIWGGGGGGYKIS